MALTKVYDEYTVINNSSSAWLFNGDDLATNASNPQIVVIPGRTYKFRNVSAAGTNAFHIKKYDSSGSSDAGASDGVTGNAATGGNTVTWTVPNNPNTVWNYEHPSTSAMSGTFVIAGNRYLNRNRNVECAGPSGNPRGYSVMNSVGPSGTEFFFVGLDGTNNNDGLISDSDTGANLNIKFDQAIFDKGKLWLKASGTNDADPGQIYLEGGGGQYGCYLKGSADDGSADWTLQLPQTAPASNGQVLSATTAGVASWSTVSGTPEGTAVLSTTNSNEANTKFLRADGDGTCSWQTPPDTTTPADNTVTAAKLDLSIVQGVVIYGTGTDTWARLAKGTASQVLTMNSGATAPEWAAAAGGGKVLTVSEVRITANTTLTDVDLTDWTIGGTEAAVTPVTDCTHILISCSPSARIKSNATGQDETYNQIGLHQTELNGSSVDNSLCEKQVFTVAAPANSGGSATDLQFPFDGHLQFLYPLTHYGGWSSGAIKFNTAWRAWWGYKNIIDVNAYGSTSFIFTQLDLS